MNIASYVRTGLARALAIAMTAITLLASTTNAAFAQTAIACAPARAPASTLPAAMSAILQASRSKYHLRAILFSAEQHGKPVLRTALGMSTATVHASTAMHFRIGAVGWQYLITLLLELADRKQLSLDDRVSTWFPSYPNASRTTLRMLAASTSGYGDYIYAAGNGTKNALPFLREVAANPRRTWTAGELIERSVPPYQKPAFDRPGSTWAYTHTGFVMLGAILERVTGSGYAGLLRRMIFEPLALAQTEMTHGRANQLPVLHTYSSDRDEYLKTHAFEDTTDWNASWVSWGAMNSTLCDLGTWNRAFGTKRLLSRASARAVTAPVNVGRGPLTAHRYFGLGTLVYPPWIVQDAAYWGMYTTTAYDPNTGMSLAVSVSLTQASPVDRSPSLAIISDLSKLLAPSTPIEK